MVGRLIYSGEKKLLFLLVIFFLLGVAVNVKASFVENCNTWNTNLWEHYWNPPDVVGGTWVCDFPVGVEKTVQAHRLEMTGYGTYIVRFRTSGPRVPGVNFYFFLYNSEIPEPNHQELDMAEIYGGNPTPREWSISMWCDGNNDYWFFQAPIDFEDGDFHVFRCIYTSEGVKLKIDEIPMFTINENPESPFIPYPPMQFIIGGNSDGTAVENFQFIIDKILYIAHNNAPDTPIITGEISGEARSEYEYTFNAVDPDNGDVKYFIDWNDGNTEWTDFSTSGIDLKVSHTWSKKGTYTVKVKAVDVFDAESSEGTLTVTMPRNKAINPFFQWFLQQYPYLLPILQLLLQQLGLQ